MDLDNGKWTIDSEGVESGGVEMHLFSLWCVPSGVRRVNKGYIQLPLVDIDLDSIFSSIPLKKMRSNSLKSPALDSASTKLAGGFSGPSSRLL